MDDKGACRTSFGLDTGAAVCMDTETVHVQGHSKDLALTDPGAAHEGAHRIHDGRILECRCEAL
jgi:hypothetical protein